MSVTRGGSGPVQGTLFDSDAEIGYRGQTACTAAGITYRQLDYWARTGLVEPSVRAAHGSGTQRLYGFRDILVLKVVKRLLDTGISLQQIRAAVRHLHDRGTEDLAQVTLMSDGVSVYECTSPDEVVDLLAGGQGVFGIALGRVWQEVEGELAELPAVRAEDGLIASGTDELATRRASKTGLPAPGQLISAKLAIRSQLSRLGESLDAIQPPGRRRGNISPEPLRHQGPGGTGDSGADPATDGEPYREAPLTGDLSAFATHQFAARHIGPSAEEQQTMLAALGYASLDELLAAALPAQAAAPASLAALPPARTEQEVSAELRRLAARNTVRVSMIGLGYYDTITPAVIRRNVLENPAWYTAYTPYQPEISQGRLEALLNFQTMVCDLAGLPVANASLLDEASAAAEAMTLARRAARGAGTVFLADADCLPQTLDVLRTRAQPLGIDLRIGPVTAATSFADVFGVLLQYPGASGEVRDLTGVIEAAHAAGVTVTVAADILALSLLKPPGEMGADVVIGSTQRFGVPMFYGGPHAAYMAVREDLKRQLPGRLVGVSVDADGRPAYRLALQAREQHIRREKATSNICTAQVLLAVAASMYACYHGADGLTAIARHAHRSAATLAATVEKYGLRTDGGVFFDTIRVLLPGSAEARAALHRASEAGYNLYDAGGGVIQVTCDETTTEAHLRDVTAALVGASMIGSGLDSADVRLVTVSDDALPPALVRTSKFLTHPVFNSYHSETAMLRYLRRLSDLDVALDRSMIPLGSCTMKLNATAEMEPVTWPEFARLHPMAPAADAAGYAELIGSLQRWLCAVTGYDAVSVQPNAGSQGELAGLLAIRAYHASRGDTDRDVCLIPESAHGTNAASAVLAGLRVVVVRCGDDGAISLSELRSALEAHSGHIAAIMLTYPSTNGVYETTITEVCDLVHEAGGQVYIDGANLNALAGLASPALLGGDVSHLNLHKTFCIPHGGGGPGVGPVAVRAHLAPFLPGTSGSVTAAKYGSAGILPISWAYIAMMGAEGLRQASQVAVLSANYIAHRLAPYFPVLHTGKGGLVAHECVIDLRRLAGGITVEDVAKRLIDYGFHAPTMSFPVSGTFMIEPTESENLAEIDDFCDAMISIRAEIDKVASGEYHAADNPLKNAPHTAEMLIIGEWKHSYPPATGGYPAARGLGSLAHHRAKYWPPVRRIDQAYGDRHLVCACPPPEAFG